MWSLLDVTQIRFAVTPSDLMLWMFCCVVCGVVASTRRYPVVPFVVLGLLLGLPGLVLTVVATAFWTPPSRAAVRQLRLAAVWAGDPVLRDRLDFESVRESLEVVRPELLFLYDKALVNRRGERFVEQVGRFLGAEDRVSTDMWVFLSASVLAYFLSKSLLAWGWWWGVDGTTARAFAGGLTSLEIWADALLPSVLYLAIRSGRLKVGFGGLLDLQHRRHLAWLGALALSAGVEPEEVKTVLTGHDLTDDAAGLGWLANCPTPEAAEGGAVTEANRLTTAVRARLADLSLHQVPLWVGSLVVYAMLVVHVVS